MDDFAGPKPMPRPNLIGPTVPPGNVPPIELAHDEKRDECDPVALTDAERAAIRQTLVAEWRDDYSVLSLVNALAPRWVVRECHWGPGSPGDASLGILGAHPAPAPRGNHPQQPNQENEMQYETHVTDEWQRNTLVIQVRAITDRGHTHGVAQAVEDTDTMGTLRIHPLALDEHEGIQTVTPTPGLRLPWDMAVSIAQAVIAKTGAPADPGEAQTLKDENDALVADLRETDQELASVYGERDRWEVLCIAKDEQIETLKAHLDREARTATHLHRTLETAQNETEWTQHQTHRTDAMESHPSNNFPGVDGRSLQDKVNESLARVARAAKGI